VTCDCCGVEFERAKRIPRYEGVFCSYLCRDYTRAGRPLAHDLPATHWAIAWGTTCTWEPPADAPATFTTGRCAECGEWFTAAGIVTVIDYCSMSCRRRVKKRARRAREHHAPGNFRYGQVMAQYRRQGNVCAYCKKPSVGLPDPEHVVPLSRGGRNDMSNIVAACRQCNTDKSDLTLSEWSASRAARRLTPVDTRLNDKAFTHLSIDESTVTKAATRVRPRAA